MKVGIVGLGFVGTALSSVLKKSVDIIKIDPRFETDISDLARFEPDIVFICVPTPMDEKGNQDISIVEEVIDEVNKNKINALLVIKSTILPNHILNIESKYKDFIYNPEFLREKYATEDFINSTLIIFGGNDNCAQKLGKFYDQHTKCVTKEYVIVSAISASYIKYGINSFLATKVIFFNQMYEMFIKSSSKDSWQKIIETLTKDPRIGETHMDVPGHDGRKGFGGACFPKDTNAFYKYSEEIDQNFTLLKEAIKVNNSIRSKYSSETKRELEQNISFNFDD
jgi:nucleotide sugar dehydrogenase